MQGVHSLDLKNLCVSSWGLVLTRNGHPSPFCRKKCDGRALLGQPFLPKRVGWLFSVRSALKRTPIKDFNYFSIMFSFMETYIALFIFLEFRMVCVSTNWQTSFGFFSIISKCSPFACISSLETKYWLKIKTTVKTLGPNLGISYSLNR